MMKRLAIVLLALLAFASPAAASTWTACLRLEQPVPNDPATNNIWGTIENTGRTLVDNAFGQTLSLSVAGNTNVSLTFANGAADQSRNAHFVFTGVLTGNIQVLFPQSGCGTMSVFNNTTGAFTLSVGADNGGGVAAGTTVSVPQTGTVELVSDGTNVTRRVDATGLGIVTSVPVTAAQGGTGRTTLTTHGVLIGEGTAAINQTAAMTNGQLLVGATAADPAPQTVSGDATLASNGALTIAAAAVTGSKIAAATITGSNIAAATIAGSNIAATTVATGNIANNAVTLAKMATQADQTVLGNVSGGAAVPVALTKTQTLTFLGVTTSGIGANGSIILPGGLYEEWGDAGVISGGSTASVTFPTSFPNAVWSVVITAGFSSNNHAGPQITGNPTTGGFTFNNIGGASTTHAYWIAFGN